MLSASVCAQHQSPPLPIEAALQEVDIGKYDRPSLSPDGRHVVYSIIDGPPLRSVTSQYGAEINLLPNGMLASMVGAQLNVTHVETGATLKIDAGQGSSWNAAFSPNGRQLAFLSDSDGMPQVWVADVASGKARRISDAQVFVKMWNALDRPVWSSDGTAIFALTVQEQSSPPPAPAESGPLSRSTVVVKASGAELKNVESEVKANSVSVTGSRVTRSAVERIEVATGARRVVASLAGEAQPFAYEVSASQRWIAFLAAKSAADDSFELFVAPTSGGEARSFGRVNMIVYDGPSASQIYSSIFHWSPVNDRLAFVQDETLKVVDLAAGAGAQARVLAGELGKISAPSMTSRPRYDQVAFTTDGNTAIARLAQPDKLAFAIVPLDGSKAHGVLVSREVRFRGLVYGAPTTLWQPKPDTFVLLCSDLTTGKQIVLQASMKDGAATVLTEEAADFTFVSSVSPNSIVGLFTDARTPQDLYQFDSTLKKRRRLTQVQPALDSISVGSSVVFTTKVPSYDGSMRTVKTAVLLPAGYRKGQALPALVNVYPDNEMSKQANQFGGGRLAGSELAQLWVTRGYAVILPDLLPLTPLEQGGANLIRELRDYLVPQIFHAAQLGYIDIDRVVLTGHSFGGYATTAVLTDTSLFRAAVAHSSAPLDFFSNTWFEWPGRVARIRQGAHPWDAFKQYLTNSPYSQADKIRTPLLLIHGSEDSVPAQTSELMFQGLQQLGKTAQLALYEGEPHYIGWWSRKNAVDATQRVLDFVDRYTGVKP